ncbi:hypothetical protein D3C76_1754550 [compost metagenome]
MNAMMAMTFRSANQNSNSPYFPTLYRLHTVSAAMKRNAKIGMLMPGNQLLRIAATATASKGITMTQNHQ